VESQILLAHSIYQVANLGDDSKVNEMASISQTEIPQQRESEFHGTSLDVKSNPEQQPLDIESHPVEVDGHTQTQHLQHDEVIKNSDDFTDKNNFFVSAFHTSADYISQAFVNITRKHLGRDIETEGLHIIQQLYETKHKEQIEKINVESLGTINEVLTLNLECLGALEDDAITLMEDKCGKARRHSEEEVKCKQNNDFLELGQQGTQSIHSFPNMAFDFKELERRVQIARASVKEPFVDISTRSRRLEAVELRKEEFMVCPSIKSSRLFYLQMQLIVV